MDTEDSNRLPALANIPGKYNQSSFNRVNKFHILIYHLLIEWITHIIQMVLASSSNKWPQVLVVMVVAVASAPPAPTTLHSAAGHPTILRATMAW